MYWTCLNDFCLPLQTNELGMNVIIFSFISTLIISNIVLGFKLHRTFNNEDKEQQNGRSVKQ